MGWNALGPKRQEKWLLEGTNINNESATTSYTTWTSVFFSQDPSPPFDQAFMHKYGFHMNRLAKLICESVLQYGSYLPIPLIPGFSRMPYGAKRMTNEIHTLANEAVKRIVYNLGDRDVRSYFEEIERDMCLNGHHLFSLLASMTY
jgi:hypothetical protein